MAPGISHSLFDAVTFQFSTCFQLDYPASENWRVTDMEWCNYTALHLLCTCMFNNYPPGGPYLRNFLEFSDVLLQQLPRESADKNSSFQLLSSIQWLLLKKWRNLSISAFNLWVDTFASRRLTVHHGVTCWELRAHYFYGLACWERIIAVNMLDVWSAAGLGQKPP